MRVYSYSRADRESWCPHFAGDELNAIQCVDGQVWWPSVYVLRYTGAVEEGTRVVQCVAHRGHTHVFQSLLIYLVWLDFVIRGGAAWDQGPGLGLMVRVGVHSPCLWCLHCRLDHPTHPGTTERRHLRKNDSLPRVADASLCRQSVDSLHCPQDRGVHYYLHTHRAKHRPTARAPHCYPSSTRSGRSTSPLITPSKYNSYDAYKSFWAQTPLDHSPSEFGVNC